MNKKYKIAVFSYWSAIYDCCTVQRLQFPLSKLQEDNKVEVDTYLTDYIDMLNNSKASFDSFISKDYDFVILHRVDIAFSFVLKFVDKLKDSNIRIIHEIDDLFYSTGTEKNDLFLSELYNKPNTSLICATKYLSNVISKITSNNIYVYTTRFPNMEFNPNIRFSDDLLIIGTDRHLSNYEKLWNEHLNNCTVPIHFFGFKPNYVGVNNSEDYTIKHTKLILNYFGYLLKLKQIPFNFGLVYLQNNGFNYCKSPIKIWEYAYSGHLALFSDCPVYSPILKEHLPELLVKEDEWFDKIHWLRNMNKFDYRDLLVRFRMIADNFTITDSSTDYYFNILTSIKNG